MCCKEKVLRSWDPLDLGYWSRVDYSVLVKPRVLLCDWFVPDDLTRGEAHDQIYMSDTFCHHVEIVAQAVSFGE